MDIMDMATEVDSSCMLRGSTPVALRLGARDGDWGPREMKTGAMSDDAP